MVSKIRLLTIGHSYIIASNRSIVRDLAGSGEFDVTVAAPNSFHGDLRPLTIDPEPTGSRLEIVGLKARGTRSIHTFRYDWAALKRLLVEGNFDLVHAWQEPYIAAGYQIAKAVAFTNSKFIFRTAQSIVKRYPPPFSWFERECLSRTDGWIAGGKLVHEAMLKRGYPPDRGQIITLAVDTAAYRPIPSSERILLQDHLGFKPPVVGFVGRLRPEKGLDLLMRAMDKIGNSQPWNLAIFGSGPLEKNLVAWANKEGWSDRLHVRLINHSEMPNVLPALDLLVAPSQTTSHWKEQFGRMVIEAFASGVPVIGSDSGEIPRVVGDAGLVVPEKDVGKWADAIKSLLSDPDLRDELSAKGLARSSQFSSAAVAGQYSALYKRLARPEPKIRPARTAPKKLLTVGHSYCVALNRRLAHELAVHGGSKWDVTAVAPSFMKGDLRQIKVENDETEKCRTIIVPLHISSRPHLMFYAGEIKQLLQQEWGLIHSWEEPYVLAGAQLAFESRNRTPFVFYSHQNIDKFYPPPFSLFEKYCLQRCSGWIAGGQTSRAILLQRGYGKRANSVLPLGVDTTHFTANPQIKRVMTFRLEWEQNGPPVVGYLGRFVSEKGIKLLCQALDRTDQPFRALFVGGGPLESYLQSWSNRYPGRVRIVTGVKHDDVPNYLNVMDVLCAPSQTTPRWREQFGRMLTEAFACGVAVLASNSGEIPFVVADAGMIFDEQDVDKLTGLLSNLLGNSHLRRTLSEKGLERVHRLYSWSRVASDHLTFFEQTLSSPRV